MQRSLDGGMINIVTGEINLSIHIRWLHDSNLISRKIADYSRYTSISLAYIAQHSEPKSLSDLAKHECIILSVHENGDKSLDTAYRIQCVAI